MPEEGEKEKTKIPAAPLHANLTWPLSQFATLMGLGEPTDTVLDPPPCVPISDLAGHLGAMSSAVRSFTLAYLSIYIIHGGEDGY